jgi:hypothetical protein
LREFLRKPFLLKKLLYKNGGIFISRFSDKRGYYVLTKRAPWAIKTAVDILQARNLRERKQI